LKYAKPAKAGDIISKPDILLIEFNLVLHQEIYELLLGCYPAMMSLLILNVIQDSRYIGFAHTESAIAELPCERSPRPFVVNPA
jgi:hypothetical protein